ncbi:Chemotaxis protein CheX [Citrifermentans bremense]|uniref:Chemotaxis protein CheX n=2 Tax=Geobacteraceae TaxID=213422 RepID=A0ABQ0MJR2_9BACT|nr:MULTISPECIES: chemotaxis protein CheX [Geobacteraceae]BCG46183.1 Chemotaxis protein CheX [Citrifermentans bremense]GAW67326.1 chemotaxis protein CheX [Geoanaerobacter pelophilus]
MALDPAILNEANTTEDEVRKTIAEITKGVFSTMVMLDVVDEPPLEEPVLNFHETVTSMVGLAGSHSGIVAIHCPKKLALMVTSNMLGMEVTDVDEDVNDAMGEIANMVGGDVKHIFSPKGADINLSIPTVIYGSDYALESISNSDALVMPFVCGEERFLLSFKIGK